MHMRGCLCPWAFAACALARTHAPVWRGRGRHAKTLMQDTDTVLSNCTFSRAGPRTLRHVCN
jgi:hypothetical protein